MFDRGWLEFSGQTAESREVSCFSEKSTRCCGGWTSLVMSTLQAVICTQLRVLCFYLHAFSVVTVVFLVWLAWEVRYRSRPSSTVLEAAGPHTHAFAAHPCVCLCVNDVKRWHGYSRAPWHSLLELPHGFP